MPEQTLPENYAAQISNLPELVLAELKSLYPNLDSKTLRDDVASSGPACTASPTLASPAASPSSTLPPPKTWPKRLVDGYLTARK